MVMNEERYNIILKKYLEGQSSLEEEQLLRDYNKQHETPEKEWFNLCNKKTSIPSGLQNRVWNNIINNEQTTSINKTKKILYGNGSRSHLWWAAAIIVLGLFSSSLWQINRRQRMQNQKLELLENALFSFAENIKSETSDNDKASSERYIIYQDENIVLYSE